MEAGTVTPPSAGDDPPGPVAGATEEGTPKLAHMPGLDGLRGWAVAAVVAYHLGWLGGGFLGVDVFFVLSGFLVTSLLLVEHGARGRVSLRRFWVRRARRLVPAVLVMVPVVLAGALVVDWPPTERGALAWDALATVTWWANWRQAAGPGYWATDPSPFRHAWSLSVEEQMYVLWPLALALVAALAVRRRVPRATAVGVLAAVGVVASTAWMTLSAHRTGVDLARLYVGTDTRLATPLVGCALACWWTGRRRERAPRVAAAAGLAGAAVLVVMVVTVTVNDPGLYRRGGFLLAAVAAAAMIVAVTAGGPGGRATGALTTGPVATYLGTRSYGLYLWSWPLQVLAAHRWPELGRGALTLMVVPASLVVAEVSYQVVEQPLRRRQGWARVVPVRRVAWATGAASVVAALAVVHARSEPPPVHQTVSPAEAASEAALRPPPPIVTDPAVTDPAAEDLRVMVTGDSVAFTAVFHAPPVPPAGIASIDGRGLIGCGVLAGAGWEYPTDHGGFHAPADDRCDLQGESEATGLSGSPHVVLAMPGAWEFSAVRSPDGHVVEAQSSEMHDVLVDALLERARAAHGVGAAYGLVEWSCPGPRTWPERRDPDYVTWINDVMATVAERARAEGIESTTIAPTDQVCVGADPAGEPTEAWARAIGDEIHVVDAAGGEWLWDQWLGPALVDWLRPS